LRLQKNMKVSARATALVLALGVVGVLVTALPAFAASTIASFTPACGVAGVGPAGTTVTITGSGFTGATGVSFNGTLAVTYTAPTNTTATAIVPVGATTGPITVINGGGDTPSAASFVVAPAAAPSITSFLPISGAVGSSVVITGTGLCGTTALLFNATPAITYTVAASGLAITATVPVGATTGALHVTTPSGTANSATSFTLAAAPTITSFTPTSGPVGTSVAITGTNLLGVTSVKFNGIAATTIGASTATSVTATVPTGATTGKISVTTPGGTATSATDFTVTTVTKHARSVNLKLKGSLTASGTVKVADGFNACRSNVTVEIQRLKNGVWKKVGSDKTTSDGKYSKALEDKSGKYRAIAKKKTLNGGDDICVADTSATVQHTHH